MKKLIALSCTLAIITCCFVACGKGLKGTEEATDKNGENYAVVTDENGNVSRDAAGNLLIAVTDEDGKAVTDENGNVVTEAAEIEHALVIGNLIELDKYYVTIPEGWQDNYSYNGIQIKSEDGNDSITFERMEDQDIADLEKHCGQMVNAAAKNYTDAVKTTDPIEIGGEKAWFHGVFIPESDTGNPVYMGYSLYENETGVYRILITSNRDIIAEPGEIFNILNTVEYKK